MILNTTYIEPGTLVGDTQRKVTLASKIREAGDGTYPVWIAICTDPNGYHQYVVWDIALRPEGPYASNGDYFHNIKDAMECYIQRGGS